MIIVINCWYQYRQMKVNFITCFPRNSIWKFFADSCVTRPPKSNWYTWLFSFHIGALLCMTNSRRKGAGCEIVGVPFGSILPRFSLIKNMHELSQYEIMLYSYLLSKLSLLEGFQVTVVLFITRFFILLTIYWSFFVRTFNQ